jgi:hypothetical protein
MYPYIHTGDSITVVIGGKPSVISTTHPNFTKISDAIKAGNWSDIDAMIDIPAAVKRFSDGELEVFDNEVLFQGEPLHNAAVDRLLTLMNQGFDVKPLVNFLNRVVNNPDPRAITGLYAWLERGKLPIAPDGCIIAYKLVRQDFMDLYTGKFDHTPGNIVSQSRFKCDSDPNQTCSSGLHFCSAEYLPMYGGRDAKVVLVKIDPADVVAFPHDYGISKGRCCRYEVMQEIDRETASTFFGGAALFSSASDIDEVDESDDDGSFEGMFALNSDDDLDLEGLFTLDSDYDKCLAVKDLDGDDCFTVTKKGVRDVGPWFSISREGDGRAFRSQVKFSSADFDIIGDLLYWEDHPVVRFTSEYGAQLLPLDRSVSYPFRLTNDGRIFVKN